MIDVDDGEGPAPLPAPMLLPFALLGAIAAFFSVLGVSLVMTDARFTLPGPAIATGGAVGGLAGIVLRRWRGLHHRWLPSERKLLRIAMVVGLAGGLIGGFVTWWSGDSLPHAVRGGFSGVVCAMFFVPGASFIVESAAKATRARHGSIVAGADRRSIWATTLAGMVIAPVIATPATAVGLVSLSLGAIHQISLVVGFAAVAVAALIALELAERRARAGLESVIATVPQLEPALAADTVVASADDLGLGEVAFSRLHLRDAYRGARHGEVVLRGDPDEAREALDDACGRRRRTRTLGLIALVASMVSTMGLATSALRGPLDLTAASPLDAE